jgi:hypothetical protein
MTEAEQIAKFISERGVTKVADGYAAPVQGHDPKLLTTPAPRRRKPVFIGNRQKRAVNASRQWAGVDPY